MTYKEYFMKCETMEELLEKAKQEICFAIARNRLEKLVVIKRAMEEVMEEKFGEEGVE